MINDTHFIWAWLINSGCIQKWIHKNSYKIMQLVSWQCNAPKSQTPEKTLMYLWCFGNRGPLIAKPFCSFYLLLFVIKYLCQVENVFICHSNNAANSDLPVRNALGHHNVITSQAMSIGGFGILIVPNLAFMTHVSSIFLLTRDANPVWCVTLFPGT